MDAEAKVTGSARYTDDNIMLGMRHAKYVRSHIAHGKVLAIDASKALALHGVEAVFTHEDVPTTCFRTAGRAWSLDETKRDVKDRRLLTDHVRHFGDGVAIVVARSPGRREGRRPGQGDLRAAAGDDGCGQRPGRGGLSHPPDRQPAAPEPDPGGRAEQAIAAADLQFKGHYQTPVVQHCHLETVTCYAYMDQPDHIIVVTSTQIPRLCAAGWPNPSACPGRACG